MKFSIIIPAYNEEEAIESIINRCLDARNDIINKTFINDVEIIVVSDGSTDSTVEIAKKSVPNILLISYPNNKGYGRAIKTGFEKASGDIVAFLDADGTCDPLYFIDMLKKLEQENADICIGSRMGASSKMPAIRRAGNKIFRIIINLIANTRISDSASGMRIIRRNKLHQIYPLPDGLHFTPAMSCRAALDPDLKLVEIEMAYEERMGQSKLNVIGDGIRFLKVIISIALTYKPLTILSPIGVFLLLVSFLYGTLTVEFYFKEGVVPEGDIYRLISVMVFGVSGILLIGMASMADKAARLFNNSIKKDASKINNAFRWFFSWKRLWFISPLLFLSGVIINYQTIISWITTREISTHWSYVIVGGYLTLMGIVGFTFGVIDYLFDLIDEKIRYKESEKNQPPSH